MNDKVLREGKLMIYNIKDFYITFTLITKKDQQKIRKKEIKKLQKESLKLKTFILGRIV